MNNLLNSLNHNIVMIGGQTNGSLMGLIIFILVSIFFIILITTLYNNIRIIPAVQQVEQNLETKIEQA